MGGEAKGLGEAMSAAPEPRNTRQATHPGRPAAQIRGLQFSEPQLKAQAGGPGADRNRHVSERATTRRQDRVAPLPRDLVECLSDILAAALVEDIRGREFLTPEARPSHAPGCP